MSKDKQQRKVLAEDVALARYSVISPLICREMTPEEYSMELARVCSALHRFPDGPKQTSKRSVSRWCSYYRHGRPPSGEPGLDALHPIARSDLGQARSLDPDIIEQAIRLREEAPSRKTSRLIEIIASQAKLRNEKPPEICESTLNYHLRARGATRKKLRAKSRLFRRFEHPHRNSCWQGDFSNGLWLPHPTQPGKKRQCFLHGFIDDRTRFIPHAEFYFRQNLPCLEDCLRKAVLKSGIPKMVYVDYLKIHQRRPCLDIVSPHDLDRAIVRRIRHKLDSDIEDNPTTADWAFITGGVTGTGRNKEYAISSERLGVSLAPVRGQALGGDSTSVAPTGHLLAGGNGKHQGCFA